MGWGDIGYNYLVDKWGNVYEGRAGGENVVGGHALQYNYGSTGLACLGDFRYAYPSAEMKGGLARIAAWTCRYLDPHGQSYFIDNVYPNICGHRDVMATECPGPNLYAYLPGLRDAAQTIIGSSPQPTPTPAPTLAAQVTRVVFTPASLAQGAELQVEVTVVNAGTAVLNTQGPAPGYRYQEGQDYRAAGYPEVPGAFRVAGGFDGDSGSGTDHPYRWGLPSPLGSGQSATVVGRIQLTTLQRRSYWAGLVQEQTRWWGEQLGVTAVKVLPAYCFAPASTAAVSSASAPAVLDGLPNHIYLPMASRSPCD
jgi:hypothetical protein